MSETQTTFLPEPATLAAMSLPAVVDAARAAAATLTPAQAQEASKVAALRAIYDAQRGEADLARRHQILSLQLLRRLAEALGPAESNGRPKRGASSPAREVPGLDHNARCRLRRILRVEAERWESWLKEDPEPSMRRALKLATPTRPRPKWNPANDAKDELLAQKPSALRTHEEDVMVIVSDALERVAYKLDHDQITNRASLSGTREVQDLLHKAQLIARDVWQLSRSTIRGGR